MNTITQMVISTLAGVLSEGLVADILARLVKHVRDADPISTTDIDNEILTVILKALQEKAQ